jgi:methylthioribose-1-phosphate isomerase
MNVAGTAYRTIRSMPDGTVEIIDQTRLPGSFALRRLGSLAEVAEAISAMRVRGAPLIGVTAAFGLALALRDDSSDAELDRARAMLLATRPTAVNLAWAVDAVTTEVHPLLPSCRFEAAFRVAQHLAEQDVAACRSIGAHGVTLLTTIARNLGRPLRVMTHCNAGWLATVDYGTALAPVYLLHDRGIAVDVWVSETRPRNQGYLTAWELAQHGVPHRVVVDSACGHLLQRGDVDVVIVGTDRTTRNGDVVNKIGTYLKALAAREAGVPFYVAAPRSSIDFSLADGRAVPIEERSAREVTLDDAFPVSNPGFDITPAHLVTGLLTERGICPASREGLARLFPERIE